MADSDKDILITPNTGAASDPSIVFSSGATGGDDVTLFVTDDGTITTLSIEGSAGQLFSVSNDLTGVIFSVNDVSGIPSLEVNADGTVSMAEFDGEVGIGTSTTSHMLHIEGRSTANTHTGIFVDSTGDAYLDLRADNTTGGAETNNPYVRFRQDQDAVETVLGFNNSGDDALGNTVTGAVANSFVVHNRFASEISLAVNGASRVGVTDALVTLKEPLLIDAGNGETLTIKGASTGTAHNNWIQFDESDDTRQGYIGFGSSGNQDLYITCDNGLVRITSPTALYVDCDIYPGNQVTGRIKAVTGQYGSVQCDGADGSAGSYTGWSVEGELVLMLSGTTGGIYDDVNNHWKLRTDTTSNTTVTGKTSSCLVYDHGNTARDVGFNVLPAFNFNASDTLEARHCGAVTGKTNTTLYTITGPTSSDLDFPVGGITTIMNLGSSVNILISDTTTCTIYLMEGDGTAPADIVGTCTLGPGGVATIYRYSTTAMYIWGNGLTL